MTDLQQGDVVKIRGFRNKFLIVSKNTFINLTGVFHVCPILDDVSEGPLHIEIKGIKGASGIVICEQMKLIDPNVRHCNREDRIPYGTLMNISDAIQGIFEYD